MQLINWLSLQPLMADVEALNAHLREARSAHDVCRSLVEITLGGFPWTGRSDLIPCYNPTRSYKPGQWIALPVPGPQDLCTAWQVARVKSAERTGNSVQGRFQALVLDVGGREVHRTGGLTGLDFPEPWLDNWSTEQLGWLVNWVAETYAAPLLATFTKLIQKGRVFGKISGETFLPDQMFALSMERLEPFFSRLSPGLCWVSLEEILQGLPDLSHLRRETALALIRSTLKVSPYRSLGADRWTTSELFDQMDRDLPYGLTGRHHRTRTQLWTQQDKKDLAPYKKKVIPVRAASALKEIFGEKTAGSDPSAWQPPQEARRLPALSTLSLTQACLPVGSVLQAFAPEVRMVFVQFMEGDYQPFLLDRDLGLLKAVHPEILQTQILEADMPAGTHFWLAHQGGEKYRIFPQPLVSPRSGPCTRAFFRDGTLHIEHSQVQMRYESEPSVYQVEIQLEDIRLLHAAARQEKLSVRDALVSAILELCAADRRKVASRADIFNTVFLKRSCSPQAVAVLLYTQSCFEELNGDFFRYLPNVPQIDIWERADSLSRLLEGLLSSYVSPDPMAGENIFLREGFELEKPFVLTLVPETGSCVYTESMTIAGVVPNLPAASTVQAQTENSSFIEKVTHESIQLIKHTLEVLTAPAEEEPVENHDQEVILEDPKKMEKANESALETVSALYPVMVRVSSEPEPQPASAIDTRRIAYGLKIPARPLHKRPIYQRVFFCLRGWVHMISGRNYETYPR